MARNDFSVMKTRITTTLHDTSLSSLAGDWINETIQDLHSRTKFIYLHVESDFNTVANQQDYQFSTIAAAATNNDVQKILYVRDRTADCILQEISYANLYDFIADPLNENSTEPTHYSIKDEFMVLFPTPSDARSLDVDFKKRTSDLVSDSDNPDLPIEWIDVIILGSEARGMRYLKRTEWLSTQQFYESEVRRRISETRRPNIRHRFRRAGQTFFPLGPRINV